MGNNGGDLPFGTINPPVNHHTKIFPRICPEFRSTQVGMGQTWACQNGMVRCMHMYFYLYTSKNLINICNIRESRFFAIDSFDPYTDVFDPSPTGTHLAEIMRIHLPCKSFADTCLTLGGIQCLCFSRWRHGERPSWNLRRFFALLAF